MGTGEFNVGGSPVMDWHPIQGRWGGVETLLVILIHAAETGDKRPPDGPLGLNADFHFYRS